MRDTVYGELAFRAAGAVVDGITAVRAGAQAERTVAAAAQAERIAMGVAETERAVASSASIENSAVRTALHNSEELKAFHAAGEAASSRAITRSTLGSGGVLDGPLVTNVQFSELSGGAQRLVRHFLEDPQAIAGIGSGIPVQDVSQASQFLNREIGILQNAEGSLIARAGATGQVYAGPGEQFLLHTHLVTNSIDSHFLLDIRNASTNVEAVIDWGGNVTHFNSSGILTNPVKSPINEFGYVVGH